MHSSWSTFALREAEGHSHRAASTHGCQEPSFDRSAPHTLPGTATAGRPRTATTMCGSPAWRGFGADCHVVAMLQGFFFCLLASVATDWLASRSSLSHSPTSPRLRQLPSFFIFLPAWVRGPPAPWHSHHLHSFFLSTGLTLHTHTSKVATILGSLLIPSSHHSKIKEKKVSEVGGISLQAWQLCWTSGVLYLTAFLVPEHIQFNLQWPVDKTLPSHPLCWLVSQKASHPCNCSFALWTWMEMLVASRFWLLNPTSTLLCPSWQWYLAAKSSDWRSSVLSFFWRPVVAFACPPPQGFPCTGILLNTSTSVFKARCLKQAAYGTLLNLSPQFTLPNTSTEDLERTPEMVWKSAQAPEDRATAMEQGKWTLISFLVVVWLPWTSNIISLWKNMK